MKKISLLSSLLFGSILLAACSLKATPDPNMQIQQSVAATLAAMPSPVPASTNRTYPTPAPINLTGLFCEYQFCIGHPPEMAFFDVSAQVNPITPSTYAQGHLIAYNASLIIRLMWQYTPGATDPIFMMDLILEDGLDTPIGTYNLRLIRNLNILSSPITTTASPHLPYGGVAGWVCGNRAFVWKAYTAQAESFETLLNEALNRFECADL